MRNFDVFRSAFNHSMCLYYYSWLNCQIDSNTGVFMYVISMGKATAIIAQEMWSIEEHVFISDHESSNYSSPLYIKIE